MSIKELIARLEKHDPETLVCCVIEEAEGVRVLAIEDARIVDAERSYGDGGKRLMKFGKSPASVPTCVIEVSEV